MDKMREEFEAWFWGYNHSDCDSGYWSVVFAVGCDGKYQGIACEGAWQGWQASRAAICVEFPDFSRREDGGEWWAGYTCAVSDVKSGLNKIGVTCK